MKTTQAYPAVLELIQKWEAHVRREAPEKKICRVSPLFGFTSTIRRFGKRFLVVSAVWSLSCFLFFLLSVLRAQSFVKVWARAPCSWWSENNN